MTSTVFIDNSEPPIRASWLNDVDDFVYRGNAKATVPSSIAGVYNESGSLAFAVGGARVARANGTAWLFDLPVFLGGGVLDVPVNSSKPQRIGFNSFADTFTSNGVTKANYGMSLGIDSTFDAINQSLHIAGYGGVGLSVLGVDRIRCTPDGTYLLGSSGAPNPALGVVGEYYFRLDTPAVPLQRIYVKSAVGVWTGVV